MTAFVICVGSSLLSKTVDVTLVLHFTPYITNIMVQNEGCILPISTDLKIILTRLYHFETVLLPNITP